MVFDWQSKIQENESNSLDMDTAPPPNQNMGAVAASGSTPHTPNRPILRPRRVSYKSPGRERSSQLSQPPKPRDVQNKGPSAKSPGWRNKIKVRKPETPRREVRDFGRPSWRPQEGARYDYPIPVSNRFQPLQEFRSFGGPYQQLGASGGWNRDDRSSSYYYPSMPPTSFYPSRPVNQYDPYYQQDQWRDREPNQYQDFPRSNQDQLRRVDRKEEVEGGKKQRIKRKRTQ